MKEKLLLISGANMSFNWENNLLRKNELSKTFEIIEPGAAATNSPSCDIGFERLNIDKIKEAVNNNKDFKHLNVIINMHGLIDEKGEYVLTRQEIDLEDDYYETINIPAKELLKDLVENTDGIPLKILISSCYGANFQNYLELLPNGSKIFTLSDKDTITFSEDVSNLTIKKAFPKTLEELFILTILSQKVTNNTPMVGTKNDDNCVVKKLTDLGMEYLASGQEVHSEIFKAINENNPKIKKAITALIEKVQDDHNLDSNRFSSKNDWETYLDYCEGKISAEAVKQIITEVNPLADISNIGFIPPFHKLYKKFKAFIENKMQKAGFEELIDQADSDEFIDKKIELRENKQTEKLKLLGSYSMLNEVYKYKELLNETKSPLDKLMAIKYGYNKISDNVEVLYVDSNNNNDFQLALYFDRERIATISLDENYHKEFQINGSSVIIDMDAEKGTFTSEVNNNKGSIVKGLGSINLNQATMMDFDVAPSMHTALCALGADSLLIAENN